MVIPLTKKPYLIYRLDMGVTGLDVEVPYLIVQPTIMLVDIINNAIRDLKQAQEETLYVCVAESFQWARWYDFGNNMDFPELKVAQDWVEFSAELNGIRHKALVNDVVAFIKGCYQEMSAEVLARR